MEQQTKKSSGISRRNWVIIWLVGLAGQLCWNVENQWFNTFVYKKIAPDPSIIAWMTAISATFTTISTFVNGTWSDRLGKRRPFIFAGYLLWGLFTIAYGATEFLPKDPLILAAVMVVAMDALMSFCGSMGNDASFNAWTTDITNEHNRGQLGAVVAAQPVIATIVGTVVSGIIIEKFDYFAFFIIMGVFVSVIGVVGALLMRESATLRPMRDDRGFLHQLGSVFDFKTFVRHKELFFVFLIMTAYFICFNFYFVHIGNYFIYALGFSEGAAGVIQGVGLLVAVLFTIPAARYIDRGGHARAIVLSVISTIVGLIVLGFSGTSVPLIEIGIVLAGVGYVLVLQTTTAWAKNLYPEGQRGQFEGVRILFFVLLPMVIGPAIASAIIKRWGVPFTNEFGIAGSAPTAALFFFAAALSGITLIPLYFANREKKKREAAASAEG